MRQREREKENEKGKISKETLKKHNFPCRYLLIQHNYCSIMWKIFVVRETVLMETTVENKNPLCITNTQFRIDSCYWLIEAAFIATE